MDNSGDRWGIWIYVIVAIVIFVFNFIKAKINAKKEPNTQTKKASIKEKLREKLELIQQAQAAAAQQTVTVASQSKPKPKAKAKVVKKTVAVRESAMTMPVSELKTGSGSLSGFPPAGENSSANGVVASEVVEELHSNESLRRAFIVQELLKKPLALRSPEEMETYGERM